MAAMSLAFSLRTEGMHRVPSTGPLLVISNHQSNLDPILIGLAARRPLRYLSKKALFDHPLFAWYIRCFRAIPVDQEGIGIEGLRLILQQLKAKRAVMVFPEGERTPNGRMQPLKPGIHLLIKRSPAPILPMGIAGAFHAWPRWRWFPKPAPLFLPAGAGAIAVSVGEPLDPSPYAAMPRARALAELREVLETMHQRAERLRRQPRQEGIRNESSVHPS
jgi:1-acyl-sn-glycerol-3-phosphate acyltransferase